MDVEDLPDDDLWKLIAAGGAGRVGGGPVMWGLTFDLATFPTATYSAVLGGAIALAVAWATTKGTRDRMSHNQRRIAEIAAHLY